MSFTFRSCMITKHYNNLIYNMRNNFKFSLNFIFCLLILAFSSTNLQAQLRLENPTGLDIELWLRADDLTLTDGQYVNQWLDRSENNYIFQQNGTDSVPILRNLGGSNFHSVLDFPASSVNSNDLPQVTANDLRRKLVSTVPFPVTTSKAYYTFVVADPNLNVSGVSTYGTFLSFDLRNDYVGMAYNGGLPFIQNSTSRHWNSTTSLPVNTSGIFGFISPNKSAVNQTMYWNGFVQSFAYGTFNTNTASQNMVVGVSNNTNRYSFIGNIAEIIVFSDVAGNTISQQNLDMIYSYFALKYGYTLSEVMTDFLDSQGNSIYSRSSNAGYTNDVFGIGRDKDSGLHQRQSSSNNSSILTVYVGDSLTTLNKNNTSTYFADKDKTFMIMGSNGLYNYVNYNYKTGDTFKNGTISDPVNFRMETVWKPQITGQDTMTVNMYAPGKYILVSKDPQFAPANTNIYHLDETKDSKNILIENGDYISMATYTYAPGGVINGLKLWLKADDLSSLMVDESNNVSVWKDQTNYNNDYSYAAVSGFSGKTMPTYLSCDNRTNFYPTISFGETSYLAIKNGPMDQNSPDDFTSFVAYYATQFTSTARLYTHGFGSTNPRNSSTRYPAMGFAPGVGAGRLRNDGVGQTDVNGTLSGFKQYTAALQMINTHRAGSTNNGGYAIHDFGGWQEKVSATGLFGNGFKMSTGGTLGGASISDGTFIGYIPEVFFYERSLSDEEQNLIRTYLGIKYGITLDADGNSDLINYDYELSNDSIVWAGNSLPGQDFHRNVAGLVRDDQSNLFNNKAKSSSDNSTITISVANHTECGQGETSLLKNDGSGLFWGHNGATVDVDVSADPTICGTFEKKTGRIWLVDKTNMTEQTVDIGVGASTYFPYGSSAYQIFLLVSSSAASLNNNKWDEVIPMQFNSDDSQHHAEYTFSKKYTYFALGVKTLSGACVACEFTGTKTLDFNNKNWVAGSTSNSFDLGDDFTVDVNTSIATGASFYNKYPRASSSKSLSEQRKEASQPVMTTEIVLSKAANATFQVFEIDRKGNLYDDVEVYGLCGSAKIIPQLNYVLAEKRSSYVISGNIARAKRTPTSGYNSNTGKMYVEFDYPVEKIYVVQKATGATKGFQRIGIGPMEFSCPKPLPPVNEDGLVMTKQGRMSATLCDEIPYTFRIYNSNCSQKSVNFTDLLSEGMSWISNSLSIDSVAIGNYTEINDYANTRSLSIDSLIIPGGTTLTFRAIALFDATATAGTYSNQSSVKYQITQNNIKVDRSLESCDRFSSDCQPTSTIVSDVQNRPSSITVSNSINGSCYKEGEEISVTVVLDNPNTISYDDAFFDLSFNQEFTYVEGSLSSQTISNLTPTESDSGYIYVDNITLPTGKSILTFKLKAPSKANLVNFEDKDGNVILNTDGSAVILPLDIYYEFGSESDDDCLGTVFSNTNGELSLPYCLSKNYIISNKMATSRIRR